MPSSIANSARHSTLCMIAILVQILWLGACQAKAQVDCFGQKTITVSRIEGLVFDPTGMPISGAVVSLKQNGVKLLEVKVDVQGKFRLRADEGKYVLQVESPGFAPSSVFLNVGMDLRKLVHPFTLRVILGLGSFVPCPSATTSRKEFQAILNDFNKPHKEVVK